MKTYGRTTILANYTEEQLLSADDKTLDEIIIEILQNSAGIHQINKEETEYLKAFYYGDQDIKSKEKHTRPEINNKTVENWAYAIVDFKKSYLLGKPIQYVQLDNSSEKEISILNRYVRFENKKAKDIMLYEDVLVTGRGFRYVDKDKKNREDEAPFELINCFPEDTEVVYSSKLGNEQLLAYIATDMMYLNTFKNDEGEIVTNEEFYVEYQVYLRNKILKYNDKDGVLKRVGDPIPLIWKEHIITEYYLNRKRIGLIELGKDLFNDINYLESLDKDDMEQSVNAIMVFTNAEVSEGDLADIRSMGAVCINSTDQKKASVDLLENRLSSQETQVYYNRLLTALHQILGVPVASDGGTIESGDTGKAKLTGQGFTSAGIRAENDETMFGMCDYNSLKVILAVCRGVNSSEIKTLKASNIDTKFQRDMTDNLMTKTQALLNLYASDIPRKYANSIVNLFGDANAVTTEQEKLFGPQKSKQSPETTSNDNNDNSDLNENNADMSSKNVSDKDLINFQNNQLNKQKEKNNQGQ